MKIETFLKFLPSNFRHEKSFFLQQKLLDFKVLSNLTDIEIYNIQKKSPLCTFNNLKKIRAIATFKKEISISPSEAYLLLHCGIGSVESLSRSTAYELEQKIRRLERKLRVKTGTEITLTILKVWIKKANQVNKSI